MSFDPNTVVSSMLGGVVAILGSITVAILYIRNQNKIENKRRLHERIQKAYFEEGILPMEAAVSEYGTSTVFALADLNTWVARCLKFKDSDENELRDRLVEISQRPAILDLTKHLFSLAMRWFPTLQRFGMPLYNTMKRTFHLYSSTLIDLLSIENIQRQISASSMDEFLRSLQVVAEIFQRTELYIERRLENLKDYVWQGDYENYSDFLQMTQRQEYKAFLSDLDTYLKHLDAFSEAFRSKKSEDRKETSLAISKWLSENIDKNPFENVRSK